jgi:hypothetical protein
MLELAKLPGSGQTSSMGWQNRWKIW